jgi:hypothetical protein
MIRRHLAGPQRSAVEGSSSRSESGSPSIRRRPAGQQGPAERGGSIMSGSQSIRRRPAGQQTEQRSAAAERSSSSRSGSPSIRRRPAGPRGPVGRPGAAAAGLVVRPSVAARPGSRGRPWKAAAAGLVVCPSVAARPGRWGLPSEAAAAGLVVRPFVSMRTRSSVRVW